MNGVPVTVEAAGPTSGLSFAGMRNSQGVAPGRDHPNEGVPMSHCSYGMARANAGASWHVRRCLAPAPALAAELRSAYSFGIIALAARRTPRFRLRAPTRVMAVGGTVRQAGVPRFRHRRRWCPGCSPSHRFGGSGSRALPRCASPRCLSGARAARGWA